MIVARPRVKLYSNNDDKLLSTDQFIMINNLAYILDKCADANECFRCSAMADCVKLWDDLVMQSTHYRIDSRRVKEFIDQFLEIQNNFIKKYKTI